MFSPFSSNNGLSKTTGKKISEYLSYHFHVSNILYEDYIGTTLSESGLTTDRIFDKKALGENLRQKIETKLASNRKMLNVSPPYRLSQWSHHAT